MDKFVSRTRRKIPEVVHFDSFERSGSRPNNSCNINTHTSPILQLSYYYIHRCIYIYSPSSQFKSQLRKGKKRKTKFQTVGLGMRWLRDPKWPKRKKSVKSQLVEWVERGGFPFLSPPHTTHTHTHTHTQNIIDKNSCCFSFLFFQK
jgi:hypothetical protein